MSPDDSKAPDKFVELARFVDRQIDCKTTDYDVWMDGMLAIRRVLGTLCGLSWDSVDAAQWCVRAYHVDSRGTQFTRCAQTAIDKLATLLLDRVGPPDETGEALVRRIESLPPRTEG